MNDKEMKFYTNGICEPILKMHRKAFSKPAESERGMIKYYSDPKSMDDLFSKVGKIGKSKSSIDAHAVVKLDIKLEALLYRSDTSTERQVRKRIDKVMMRPFKGPNSVMMTAILLRIMAIYRYEKYMYAEAEIGLERHRYDGNAENELVKGTSVNPMLLVAFDYSMSKHEFLMSYARGDLQTNQSDINFYDVYSPRKDVDDLKLNSARVILADLLYGDSDKILEKTEGIINRVIVHQIFK